MSRDVYYLESYKCSNCGTVSQHYVWASELKKAKRFCICESTLTIDHIVEEAVASTPFISKNMSKADIRKERKQRSTDHFRREIMPTLKKGSQEDRHFRKKYGDK